MLPKGSKVPNPHVRGVNKSGVLHAVPRTKDATAKAECGATVTVTQPLARFQQIKSAEICPACNKKVLLARALALIARKRNLSAVKAKAPAKAKAPVKKAPVAAKTKAPAKTKTAPAKKAPAKAKSPGKAPARIRAPRVAVKA